jgi:predicted transcriptional regulator
MAKAKPTPTDPVLVELMAIKRLIVFALLRSGVSQEQVARALGTSQPQVSRMFPDGIGKRAQDTTEAE